MSTADKARHEVEDLVGKAKEAAGKATEDTSLEYEGKTDQVKAKAKKVGEDIKNVFK